MLLERTSCSFDILRIALTVKYLNFYCKISQMCFKIICYRKVARFCYRLFKQIIEGADEVNQTDDNVMTEDVEDAIP